MNKGQVLGVVIGCVIVSIALSAIRVKQEANTKRATEDAMEQVKNLNLFEGMVWKPKED
jgi:hypothetical protein